MESCSIFGNRKYACNYFAWWLVDNSSSLRGSLWNVPSFIHGDNELCGSISTDSLWCENQLSKQRCYHKDGCFYVTSKAHFFLKSIKNHFVRFLISIWRNLVTEFYFVTNRSSKYCSLSDCSYHILLNNKIIMRQKLHQLIEVHFTYHFFDCFYTKFNFRLKERVCTKNGQLFHIVERAVNFNQNFKIFARIPRVTKKIFLMKKFEKPMHWISKETNFPKKKPTTLLQYITNIIRSNHKTDIWRKVVCFSHRFGDSESDFESHRVRDLMWPCFWRLQVTVFIIKC